MRTVALLLLALGSVAADPPAKLDRHGDPLPPGAVQRLGTVRNRAPITSFGITQDGTVVTIGPDVVVRAWAPDRDLPAQVTSLGKPSDSFFQPQVSPDGRLAATRDKDTVRVWDWRQAPPKEVAAFGVPAARSALFAPDGAKLVAVGELQDGHQLVLCDVATGKTATLDTTTRHLEALAFSGDGKRFGTATDRGVRVLSAADGKLLGEWAPDPKLRVAGLALDANGGVVAALPMHAPWTVHLRDALTGKPVPGLTGPASGSVVSFSADDKLLLLCDRTGVRLYDPRAAKQVGRFEGMAHSGYGGAHPPARLTPDGKTLVATSGAALLRWDAATGRPRFPDAAGHVHHAGAIGVSPDGTRYATGSHDETVRVWDAATGRPLVSVAASFMNQPNIEFAPDGKHMYCPSADHGTVVKWDAATGAEVLRFEYQKGTPKRGSLSAFGLTADGKTVLAASTPNELDFLPIVAAWDAETGAVRSQTAYKERHLFNLPLGRFSPDGTRYASHYQLHPLDDLTKTALPPKMNAYVGAFSADGRYCAWVGYDRTQTPVKWAVHLTDLKDDTHAAVAPATSGRVALGLSGDGRALAVVTEKGVRFYDARTGKELAAHVTELAYPRAARFTPDGKHLLTAHDDTAPLVWPAPQPPAK